MPYLELLRLQQGSSLKELWVLVLCLMQDAVSHARARGGSLVSRGEPGESLEVVSKLAEFSDRQSFPGPLGMKPDF